MTNRIEKRLDESLDRAAAPHIVGNFSEAESRSSTFHPARRRRSSMICWCVSASEYGWGIAGGASEATTMRRKGTSR
jgi:hypothetical protein